MSSAKWKAEHHDEMCLYRRRHYQKNKADYIRRALARNVRVKEEARAWVDEYKMQAGCKYCGYNKAPEALDLDHKEGKKRFTVSVGVHVMKLSLESIKEEVKKCDVVCANCHRIITKHRRVQTVMERASKTRCVGSTPTSPAIL